MATHSTDGPTRFFGVLSFYSNIFVDAVNNDTSEPAYHDHTEANDSFLPDMERLAADAMQCGDVFPRRGHPHADYAADDPDHVMMPPHSVQFNFY